MSFPPRRFVLGLWLVVWAVACAHSARHWSEPMGLLPVEVERLEAPDAYPVVLGQRRWVQEPASDLRRGDRLLRLADEDLRGRDPLGVFLRFAVLARGAESVSVVYERDGARLETRLPANPARFLRVWLFVSLVYAAVAVLLWVRAPPSPMVRTFFHAFMATATFFASCPDNVLSVVGQGLGLGLTCSLNLLAFQRFPHDEAPRSRWARWAPWLFLALAPFHTSRFGAPLPPRLAEFVAIAGVLAFFVTLLVVATHNYWAADAIGRRQLRWVLFGLYLALLPPMLSAALVSIDSRWTDAYAWNLAAAGMIPLSLLISVIRYGLFDVDRLISVAATYNLLLGIAFTSGLVLAPRVGDLAAAPLGLEPETSRVAVAVLITLVLLPTQRWLRPRVERTFFRERWNLDHGIEELARQIRSCGNPSDLTERIGTGLARLLRPERCVVYARREGSFSPVFVRGPAVPPAFPADGSLVRALRDHTAPLDADAARWRDRAGLDPFERAALDTLGATLLVPIRVQDLDAFIVLGRKRSGDIYAPTDLAVLAMLADQVAARLRSYDQELLVRESREMQEKLRRYVPNAVIQQLAGGAQAVSGRCEVSVLFVDIRGYTSFAEQRSADEIFSTLNRYTELVSKVIDRCGGNVVEFNGDGLMAVFGAPNPLVAKEAAAVEAARQIVELMHVPQPNGSTQISVGVGIATGEAYVGDIRSADRMVWSAVGNTTNLAARLQQLTRDWDAAIVIDERTHAAAGSAAARFAARDDARIRGRSRREQLYLLPLEGA